MDQLEIFEIHFEHFLNLQSFTTENNIFWSAFFLGRD